MRRLPRGHGRTRSRAELAERIGEDELICLPTTPTLAPLRGTASDEVEIDYRRRTMELLCSAGLGGLPQLTIPVGTVDGSAGGVVDRGAARQG